MFGFTLLELIHMLTSVLAGGMTFLCLNECFENIDNGFIKLKKEKKALEAEIEELKREKNDKDSISKLIPGNDINTTLLKENLRLQVRCDMLTEIHKKRNECETCFKNCQKCIKNL